MSGFPFMLAHEDLIHIFLTYKYKQNLKKTQKEGPPEQSLLKSAGRSD